MILRTRACVGNYRAEIGLTRKYIAVIQDQTIQSVDEEIIVHLGIQSHWNAVRSPFRSGLLEVLTSGKPATARQLADIFNIEAPLVHYHLGLLEEAGFITGERMLGKRGKIYSAVGKRVRVQFNSELSAEQDRAKQLADSWLRASMNDILDGLANQGNDENPSHVIFNWESLCEDDMSQIKQHFDGVQKIMATAKARRHKASLEEQRPTCHVLFSVISKDFSMPPNPEFSSLVS